MTEETKNNINIDGADYAMDDLTPEQQKILTHIADLNTKIQNVNFQIEQLRVAQSAFKTLLKNSLNAPVEEAQAAADTAKAESEK
jgi:hypothetical protein|tara:strand:+ start:3375 stop:3629 length:255 start_codon:yes stop_codon:yes gene_type:complete